MTTGTKTKNETDPRIQALGDALAALLLQKHNKKSLLELSELLIDLIQKAAQQRRGERYIVDRNADDLKIIGTVPMSRYSRLITDAFDDVLGELEIEPEIEQSLERLLAPHEQPNGEHYEPYYDLWCGLTDEIKPSLRAVLLPLITHEGFGELLQQSAHERMRDAEHIRELAKKKRREERGIKLVKNEDDDA